MPAAEDTVGFLGMWQCDNAQYLETVVNHRDAQPLRTNALYHLPTDALDQTPEQLEQTEQCELNVNAESGFPQ